MTSFDGKEVQRTKIENRSDFSLFLSYLLILEKHLWKYNFSNLLSSIVYELKLRKTWNLKLLVPKGEGTRGSGAETFYHRFLRPSPTHSRHKIVCTNFLFFPQLSSLIFLGYLWCVFEWQFERFISSFYSDIQNFLSWSQWRHEYGCTKLLFSSFLSVKHYSPKNFLS